MGIKFGGLIGSVTAPVASAAPGIWDVRDIYGNIFLNKWPAYTIPFAGLAATGGTLTTGNSYNQWAFTSSSTWTVTAPGIAYYAIVAGGGGGAAGSGVGGGGSGAGGVITGILSANVGTYSVIVGGGGSAGTSSTGIGGNGNNSTLAGLSAVGGGSGGYDNGLPSGGDGTSGGSGGGCRPYGGATPPGFLGIAGQGWQGGNNGGYTAYPYPTGGGGGAGGVGGNGTSTTQSGNGGPGLSIYLPASGVSTYVGGGGGGCGWSSGGTTAGAGGLGGGGAGSTTTGGNGVANTGGGGGGGSASNNGGTGGSGVVYIWAPSANLAKTPYVNYLVVAGGGNGGNNNGGGGGGGGLITGVAQVSSGTTYTVTVGAGGPASTNASNQSSGTPSGLSALNVLALTARGGGGGGTYPSPGIGVNGGSGGGGGTVSGNTAGGSGTTGLGYNGGTAGTVGAAGGGGYGMPGWSGTSTIGGNGGDGGTFGIVNGTGQNWSNYFTLNSGYLSTPWTSNFDFGTGDWTLEGWFFINQFTTVNNQMAFIINGQGAANNGSQCGWWLRYDTPNTLSIMYFNNNSSYVQYTYTYTLNINQWYHIACTKASGIIRMFVNGTQTGSNQSDSTSWSSPNGTQAIYINACQAGGGGTFQSMGGYFSNVRVVKGTAVYTSNFTPSVSALSAISGTVLLTCQSPSFIDNSSNKYTLTSSGNPYIASQNPFGVSYAGGGGGGTYTSTPGYGGMGGGGAGGSSILNSGTGTAGAANTGGGGGGSGNDSTGAVSGAGGSGIVVLSYPTSYPVAASTTGSPSLSTINGNIIYKFTASGSITF